MTAPRSQAVVLAAGLGTRMRSRTAKALQPVFGIPLLEHVLRAVVAVAAEPVLVVVGHRAEAVEAAFAGRAVFVRQEPPLGTGHALLCAREHFARPETRTVLVVNGDLPLLRGETLRALLDAHGQSGAAATLLTAALDDPGPYGRILRDQAGRVLGIREAKDASAGERGIPEINAGVYAFEVAPLLQALARLSPQNAQGEYYLTDVIGLLASSGQRVEAFPAADPSEAWGVNTFKELAAASRRLRERTLDALMSTGVTIEDPESTHVGLEVTVEADAVLRPFIVLEGRTRVGTGARVGPFARLADVEVGPDAQILDHCLLRECVVEAGASVGPFTHVRPESHIGAGARVGNFVELKKTRLGQGAKAPHLSYLGDATIGSGVNVGAGTITCNYDGRSKHKTEIGAGAFVGSNSTLVAPLSVGPRAYVAAGSVVTEDVPEDALALGRARQVVKPGWAARRRAAEKARTGSGDKR